MDDITKALQQARYNEIVEVSISSSNNDEEQQQQQQQHDDDVAVNRDEDNNVTDEETNNIVATKTTKGNDQIIQQQEQEQQQQQKQIISLIPCLDEIHGGIQWNPISENENNNKKIISRYLQTKRWMFPMLNDTYRNEQYYKAINKACYDIAYRRRFDNITIYGNDDPYNTSDEENENESRYDNLNRRMIRILDIGCGTGLLGMMAVQCLRQYNIDDKYIYVTAYEMSTSMAAIAKQIIVDNHMGCVMHVVEGHSCDHHNAHHRLFHTHKYNLCLCELLDDTLLGEGIIPTLRHAWEHYLNEDTIIIPSQCNVYAQGVTTTANHCHGQDIVNEKDDPLLSPSWISQYSHLYDQPLVSVVQTSSSIEHHNDTLLSFNRKQEHHHQHHQHHLYEQQNDNNDCVIIPIHASKLLHDKKLISITNPIHCFNISFQYDSNHMKPLIQQQELAEHDEYKYYTKTMTIDNNTNQILLSSEKSSIDGILIWWDVNLYDDISYSIDPTLINNHDNGDNTKVSQQLWQDHWHPCLHVLRDPIMVENKQTIQMTIRHNDTKISIVSIDTSIISEPLSLDHQINNDNDNNDISKRRKIENINTSCSSNIIQPSSLSLLNFDPDRTYQLNDINRRNVLTHSIINSLNHMKRKKRKDKITTLLDLSDFSYCGIIAGLLNNEHVISIESSTSATQLSLLSSQLASHNNLPKNLFHSLLQQEEDQQVFEILQCHYENLTSDVIGTIIDIVIAEPYYEILQGWHLQEALNFYYIIRYLYSKQIFHDNVIILPSKCNIMGCIIECNELRSAYRPCGDTNNNNSSILGLDHTYLNQIGGYDFDKYDLSLPMWQYNYKVLSESIVLGTLQYQRQDHDDDMNDNHNDEMRHSIINTVQGTFCTSGVCDALLVWLEYDFRPPTDDDDDIVSPPSANIQTNNNNDTYNILSTNNQAHKQIIRMLKSPTTHIIDDDVSSFYFECQSTFGGMSEQSSSHDFQIKICKKSA